MELVEKRGRSELDEVVVVVEDEGTGAWKKERIKSIKAINSISQSQPSVGTRKPRSTQGNIISYLPQEWESI